MYYFYNSSINAELSKICFFNKTIHLGENTRHRSLIYFRWDIHFKYVSFPGSDNKWHIIVTDGCRHSNHFYYVFSLKKTRDRHLWEVNPLSTVELNSFRVFLFICVCAYVLNAATCRYVICVYAIKNCWGIYPLELRMT